MTTIDARVQTLPWLRLSLPQAIAVVASVLTMSVAGSLIGGQRVAAQAIQPTGQAAPVTQNPQLLPRQELAAPSSSLQGNTGAQATGLSFNQQPGQSQRIRVPGSTSVITAGETAVNPSGTTGDVTKRWFHKPTVIAAGILAVLFGATTLILAKRGRSTELAGYS